MSQSSSLMVWLCITALAVGRFSRSLRSRLRRSADTAVTLPGLSFGFMIRCIRDESFVCIENNRRWSVKLCEYFFFLCTSGFALGRFRWLEGLRRLNFERCFEPRRAVCGVLLTDSIVEASFVCFMLKPLRGFPRRFLDCRCFSIALAHGGRLGVSL